MRKLVLTLAAIASVALTVPLATSVNAQHSGVSVQVGGDHNRGVNRGHRRTVVIKQRGHGQQGRGHERRRAQHHN